MLYRYVQSEETGKWRPVPLDKDYTSRLDSMGATRVSILAVSCIIDDDTDPEEIKYLGPLYFDIDLESNLHLAISSAQELVSKLRQLEVPDEGIQVYASGAKGFHILVPESLFLQSRKPVRFLPRVYMEVARDLYVMGLDFAVYSGGRGRLFRFENAQRPDGAYRVRITLQELEQMTPELYHQIVQSPRALQLPGPNGHKSVLLTDLVERAMGRVRKKQILRGTALPVEALKPYAEEPPGCVDMLTKGDLNNRVKFNQAAMQFASFVSRSGMPDYKVDSLANQMAEATESGSYNTAVKRKIHLIGLVSYARARPNLQFTCAAMRSVLANSKCCADCPLNKKDLKDSKDVDEDGAVLGVIAEPDGYYLKRENGDSRISTFTLHPIEVYLDPSQGDHMSRRVGTQMEVYVKHEKRTEVYFQEEGWSSKQMFLKQFEGLSDLTFIGTDADIQRLKYTVYRHNEEDEVDEVVNVYAVGIHDGVIGRKRIYTYVEPGLSINSYNIQGTHRLQGTVTSPPNLRQTAKPEPRDQKVADALRNLIEINAPHVVSQMLGWVSACHLKRHLIHLKGEFPSINLWGASECGKTLTAKSFSLLNCIDYFNDGGAKPTSVSLATPFPIISACSNTTTIPRILEEFNESQMKRFAGYEMVTEIIKASWQEHPVERGMLNRSRANGSNRTGAHVEDLKVTSPLIVCSEQRPDKPALQNRMVMIHLTHKTREGRSKYFYLIEEETKPYLLSFGRAMTMMAIKTKDEWVKERFYANFDLLPPMFRDRAALSYTTLLLGLDYFIGVSESLELGIAERITTLKTDLIQHLSQSGSDIQKRRAHTEVDIVLTEISLMVQMSLQDISTVPLIKGKQFLCLPNKDELVLDMKAVFMLYKRHTRLQGDKVVFNSFEQFEPLLKTEPYFISDLRVQREISTTRRMWVLSLSKMQAKGIDTSLFLG